MSQRRGRGGKKRSSSQMRQEEEEEEMETQQTQTQTQDNEEGGTQSTGRGAQAARRAFSAMDQETVDHKVAEIVRYLLCMEKRRQPVSKKELQEKVLGAEHSRAFLCLMPLAAQKLEETFGLAVQEVTPDRYKSDGSKVATSKVATSIRYFILTNQIAADAREALLPCSEEEKAETGLLFVILSLIMLKGGDMQEEHLWNVLGRLNIQSTSPQQQLGDVDTIIKKDFVEQKYLERVKITAGEQYRYVYRWGPRAKATVDKKQLLSLVAELHGDSVAQWEAQFAHVVNPSQN